MARFLAETVADMRGGRESWRVHLTLGLPSLGVAIVLVALSRLW